MARQHQLIVTLEENTLMGGAGSAINEFLLREDHRVSILNLGLPDAFLSHGKVADILAKAGLDTPSLVAAIRARVRPTQYIEKIVY
jgi:1-deoxy-D-xylulose-5-phosphate synthase